MGGAPTQLHTCNSLETSTTSNTCHISNNRRGFHPHAGPRQAQEARPARTSAEATVPFNSSMVIATSR